MFPTCTDVSLCWIREALTLLLDTFHNEAESFLLSEVTFCRLVMTLTDVMNIQHLFLFTYESTGTEDADKRRHMINCSF